MPTDPPPTDEAPTDLAGLLGHSVTAAVDLLDRARREAAATGGVAAAQLAAITGAGYALLALVAEGALGDAIDRGVDEDPQAPRAAAPDPSPGPTDKPDEPGG